MLKLEFIDVARQPLWLVDKALSIGRTDENQLVLDDPAVAAQHARILCQPDGYFLRDLDSDSGTFVNDQRIHNRRIVHGDQLRFGNTITRLVDPYAGDEGGQAWTLVACSSWLSGQEFAVNSKHQRSTITLGRGKNCDILLPGTHLSREHAEFVIHGYRLHVKDLNSANGTFINDQRIDEAWAEAGDRLRFDVYNFVLVGPRQRQQEGADSSPAAQTAAADANETPEQSVDGTKHWKIPPTSPGNRSDADPPPATHFTPYLIAGGLLLASMATAVYVFLA